MLNYNNIDINDARQGTKYPFTHNSTLDVNGVLVPVECFRAIRIYCAEGDGVPVHIGSISRESTAPDVCVVEFDTATGAFVGSARIKSGRGGGFLIFDDRGVIRGQMVCDDTLAALLLNALGAADTVALSGDTFTLLPQCHVAWMAGHCRSVELASGVTRADVVITPGRNIRAAADGAYELGVVDDWKGNREVSGINWLASENPITIDGMQVSSEAVKADPIWVGGAHIWLRHSLTSNMRVVPNEAGLQIRGVMDE